MMENRQEISFKIQNIRNLPPLPEASAEILLAVTDPEISLNQLSSVLFTSPTLSARLLGIANSAYFGQSGGIKTVREAIIRVLGFPLVRSLVLSIILNLELDTKRCIHFNSEKYWSETIITATMAQKVATLIDNELNLKTVYTAGLLLNIGILAVIHLYPKEIDDVFVQAEQSNNSVSHLILNVLEFDHYQLGYFLMVRWQLPDVYQTILKEYNNQSYTGEQKKLIRLLKHCRKFSKHLYENREYDSLLIDNSLESIGASSIDLESTFAEITSKLDDIIDLARTLNTD